jgi:hypothetical protein
MKAQTLAISIPNYGCDKDCRYCISKMTGYLTPNQGLFQINLNKVKTIATSSNVVDVVLTSKGEICDNEKSIEFANKVVISNFNVWPIVLQTNGLSLKKREGMLEVFNAFGLNILAVSIDTKNGIPYFGELFDRSKSLGLLNRVTINLTKEIIEGKFFEDFIKDCLICNVDQISFREITIPTVGVVYTDEATKTVDWIMKNGPSSEAKTIWLSNMDSCLKEGRILRKLPYGPILYDYKGISVTHFPYCIQDDSNDDDIRSLIYQEDGHLYTSWNSKASKIF